MSRGPLPRHREAQEEGWGNQDGTLRPQGRGTGACPHDPRAQPPCPPPSLGPGPAQLALSPPPGHSPWTAGELGPWCCGFPAGFGGGPLASPVEHGCCLSVLPPTELCHSDHGGGARLPSLASRPSGGTSSYSGDKTLPATPISPNSLKSSLNKHPGSCLRVTWGPDGSAGVHKAGTNTQPTPGRAHPRAPQCGSPVPFQGPMAFLPRTPQVWPGTSQRPGAEAGVGQRAKALGFHPRGPVGSPSSAWVPQAWGSCVLKTGWSAGPGGTPALEPAHQAPEPTWPGNSRVRSLPAEAGGGGGGVVVVVISVSFCLK